MQEERQKAGVVKKERVVLAVVYKEDGNIKVDVSEDAYGYELFGFLKCYVQQIEKALVESIEPSDEEGLL